MRPSRRRAGQRHRRRRDDLRRAGARRADVPGAGGARWSTATNTVTLDARGGDTDYSLDDTIRLNYPHTLSGRCRSAEVHGRRAGARSRSAALRARRSASSTSPIGRRRWNCRRRPRRAASVTVSCRARGRGRCWRSPTRPIVTPAFVQANQPVHVARGQPGARLRAHLARRTSSPRPRRWPRCGSSRVTPRRSSTSPISTTSSASARRRRRRSGTSCSGRARTGGRRRASWCCWATRRSIRATTRARRRRLRADQSRCRWPRWRSRPRRMTGSWTSTTTDCRMWRSGGCRCARPRRPRRWSPRSSATRQVAPQPWTKDVLLVAGKNDDTSNFESVQHHARRARAERLHA